LVPFVGLVVAPTNIKEARVDFDRPLILVGEATSLWLIFIGDVTSPTNIRVAGLTGTARLYSSGNIGDGYERFPFCFALTAAAVHT
jgi:hypothetical protein